jgi:hypothetical protein
MGIFHQDARRIPQGIDITNGAEMAEKLIADAPETVEELKGLMTTAQVADLFGKSPLTITLWRKEKGLPYVRIPGDGRDTIRFHEGRVKKWAKKNQVQTSPAREGRARL